MRPYDPIYLTIARLHAGWYNQLGMVGRWLRDFGKWMQLACHDRSYRHAKWPGYWDSYRRYDRWNWQRKCRKWDKEDAKTDRERTT